MHVSGELERGIVFVRWRPTRARNTVITVNGRFLTQKITGSQRYAHNITRRLISLRGAENLRIFTPRHEELVPERFAEITVRVGRLRGHAWEQLELGRSANR